MEPFFLLSSHVSLSLSLSLSSQDLIFGKEVTPFVLSRVNELTGGNSLALNVALIENNAKVGAEIAVAWHELKRLKEDEEDGLEDRLHRSQTPAPTETPSSNEPKSYEEESARPKGGGGESTRPVVIGGSIADIVVRCEDEDFQQNGGTYKGNIFQVKIVAEFVAKLFSISRQ